LLRNGLNRGDETVPHIPYPGELSHLMPENPAVSRRTLHCTLEDSLNN
jgi:hypothetical protein